MPGQDVLVFSWNVEKKSVGQLEADPDLAPRLSQVIARTVARGPDGADTNFIGFLLEIKGTRARIAEMCTKLSSEFDRTTGTTGTLFRFRDTGGAPSTREAIIVVSRGVEAVVRDFDAREKFADFVEEDKRQANEKAEKKKNHLSRAARSKSKFAPNADRLRKVNRPPEWYRNGVMADFMVAGREYRAGSIHAPGPDITSRAIEVVDCIIDKAQEDGINLLIGDFNRDGVFGRQYYRDLTKNLGSGTTYKKSALGTLGKRKRDRAFHFEPLVGPANAEGKSAKPFATEMSADLVSIFTPGDTEMISDHAVIYSIVGPASLASKKVKVTPSTAMSDTLAVATTAVSTDPDPATSPLSVASDSIVVSPLLGSAAGKAAENPLGGAVGSDGSPLLNASRAPSEAPLGGISIVESPLSISPPAPVSPLLEPQAPRSPNPLGSPIDRSELLLNQLPSVPTEAPSSTTVGSGAKERGSPEPG